MNEYTLEMLKANMPYFNIQDFEKEARLKFLTVIRAFELKEYKYLDGVCEKEYIPYLNKNNEELFKLHSDIDYFALQNLKIIDYKKGTEFDSIITRAYGHQIDYMHNNTVNFHPERRRYIEKEYHITFRAPSFKTEYKNKFVCDKCGAMMKKRIENSTYNCEYCGNFCFINYNEWKISDIERIDN